MIDDFKWKPGKPASKDTPEEEFFPDLSQANNLVEKPKKVIADNGFVTPEQAAVTDHIEDTIDMADPKQVSANKIPKEKLRHRISAWFHRLSKKQKALLIFSIILILAGISIGASAILGSKEVANVKPAPKAVAEVPKPKTVASALTGLQVDPSVNEKPVIGAIIENSTDARPQSGLYDAGVVFEAIAEGGITRFLALFQGSAPENIGPVRSLRPYYIDWVSGFDAPIAHVGGSPEALSRVKNEGIKDLDQFFNSAYYRRASNRYAPHNVYTSIGQLNQAATARGYDKSKFTSFERKKDAPSATPTAKTVNINISSVKYNVQYTYDTATNSYLRNMAGAAHVDENNSKQIAPKVVIAMVVPYSIHSNGKHSVYGTTAGGQVQIFQNGEVTVGTWQKTGVANQLSFTDQAGTPIKLNSGQTWISMVSAANKVTYQP